MRKHTTPRTRHRRGGLAPLEFVLSLPILLFIAALMVNFGDLARWKIQTQIHARHAAWRSLSNRTGDNNPQPADWPGELAESSSSRLNSVEAIWNADPRLQNEVVDGPAGRITIPQNNASIVVRRELNLGGSVHQGTGRLQRRLHQLRGILPNDGRYRFHLDQQLLDDGWQFHRLGFGSNRSRRAKQWYQLDPENLPPLQPLFAQFELARTAMAGSGFGEELDPLDRDPEFIAFTGDAPDFHPRLGGCAIEANRYRQSQRYREFRQELNRLPIRMARRFRQLYRREINRLQQLDDPPAGQIQELRDKITHLDRFLEILTD